MYTVSVHYCIAMQSCLGHATIKCTLDYTRVLVDRCLNMKGA